MEELTRFEQKRLRQLIGRADEIVDLMTDVEDSRGGFRALATAYRRQILDVLGGAHAEAKRELDDYRLKAQGRESYCRREEDEPQLSGILLAI